MADPNSFKVDRLFGLLDGYTAVVTGGGTGIGLMSAQALANNGAKVYIVGRRKDALETAVKSHGQNLAHKAGQIIPVVGDVGKNKEEIQKVVDEIAKTEKHIHLLINNAGIDTGKSDYSKGDESAEALSQAMLQEEWKEWEDVMRTNVIGYYFTSAAFLPLLSAATKVMHGKSASIINISSISGILRSSQNHISYNVSKAATIQLNTMLAQEFSRVGVKVRVNSIAPGVFPSEMTAKDSNEINKSQLKAEGYRENKDVKAGRPGQDADMAQAVIFAAVNDYMNGQVVTVDGGYLLGNP